MDPKPDVILYDIEQTRNSLTKKIGLLEDQVKGTMENAKASVDDTIDNIKSGVRSVRQTFDPHYQVDKHPWTMIGASVATGFLIGTWIGKKPNHRGYNRSRLYTPAGTPAAANESHEERKMVEWQDANPKYGKGLLDVFTETFGEEIKMAKTMAIAAIVNVVGDKVKDKFPNAAPQINQILESAAEKVKPH